MKLNIFETMILTLKSSCFFVAGAFIIIVSWVKWFFLMDYTSKLVFGTLIGLIFLYIGYDQSWKTYSAKKMNSLEGRFDSHFADKGGIE